jgi:hypothetical protein
MRVLCRWLLQVPTRHPGVALAIACVPKETRVPAAVFLFLLVNVLVTVP